MDRLTISSLRSAYLQKSQDPRSVLTDALHKIRNSESSNAWITVISDDQLDKFLADLENKSMDDHPLWGVPFAIKDNIDLLGCPTTAGCPAYKYLPEESAHVVQQLIDAGAVPLGKTNLDQFATGLVGTRSPFGAVSCIYNKDYISGGSSSGSAYAVASGQVAFSLGTDTAGSGRVPAAFNGLVGVKPTRGILSCTGVVPACKSLDCVSIFCNDLQDANSILNVATSYDERDSYSREADFHRYFSNVISSDKPAIKVGVPRPEQLYFLDSEYPDLFEKACQKIRDSGLETVAIDFQPFMDAAKLLYQGPWVAERFHAVGEFIENNLDACDEAVATIIRGAESITGKRAFDGFYRLQALNKLARAQLSQVDCIVTPTTPTQFTHEEIAANPILNNSELGFYTNFMNLLDFAALSIPAGMTSSGLGFGITLFAEAQTDIQLQQIAAIFSAEPFSPATLLKAGCEMIPVAVCGAHLSGMALNWQLIDRGARLLTSTSTSPNYRFYALAGGPPYRPGLERVEANGFAIDVEVWDVPAALFGSFVAGIPKPLGIGKVELADGSWVPGFICEPCGISDALDISEYQNWRNYIQKQSS